MKISFEQIKDAFKNLLFTKRCKYCGEVVDLRYEICNSCAADIPRISGEICFSCGAEKAVCRCGGKKHYYEAVCAPYYYEGAPRVAILNFKFKSRRESADFLGKEMAECFKVRYGGYHFDKCTYVPCTEKKEKQRGFNQAKALAECVSELLDIPCCELLKKSFENKTQHKLPKMERSGNVIGAFDAVEENIDNMRVLLVDDIKTTGATLNECAKTLMINGAAEVFCLVAALSNKEVN